MSFSDTFDEIREARRQDDSLLAQGDWETDLKTAQWPRVKELCEDILRSHSKDMQVVAWYTEAMAHLKGFEGLSLGLQVMDGLINDFWEFCYPSYDPDDLERAGKSVAEQPVATSNTRDTAHRSRVWGVFLAQVGGVATYR